MIVNTAKEARELSKAHFDFKDSVDKILGRVEKACRHGGFRISKPFKDLDLTYDQEQFIVTYLTSEEKGFIFNLVDTPSRKTYISMYWVESIESPIV